MENKEKKIITEKSGVESKNIKNAEKIGDILKSLQSDILRDDIIRDNKIEFSLIDVSYRVRMPTNKEKNRAEKFKAREYIKLRRDKDYVTRGELIDLHKESGVDVEKFDEDILIIQDEINCLYESLAQVKSENKNRLKSLEENINKKFIKIQKLSIAKAELLAFCIEEEVYSRYIEYLIICCTEYLADSIKTGEENWQRTWNTQEEFDDDDNTLLAETATMHMSRLFSMMRRF